MKYILLLLFMFSTFYFYFQNLETVELKIIVTNINTKKGNIEVGVFQNQQSFLVKGKEYKSYSKKVITDTVIFILKDLKKDSYAFSIYHDINSDKKCNLNFIGFPVEPYGFSNNYKIKLSKPTFNDCKVDFTKNRTIEIKLVD